MFSAVQVAPSAERRGRTSGQQVTPYQPSMHGSPTSQLRETVQLRPFVVS